MKKENHNPYYFKGTKLIEPYMHLEGKFITINAKAKDSIVEGIRYLDAVTQINPNNFAAYWIKGKGYQALQRHDNAYFEFNKSFEIEKNNPDVARELTIECLDLGKGKEAVSVATHALSLDNLNVGLIGNLALAYLINGDTDLADKRIKEAIQADPNDKINLRLSEIINDVIVGKRNRPTRYDEIKL
ncbi:tetratricopeptide repeat protein [Arachidicoccus ginsenosidimutans]|uniref:tetratricopeptide repeat protein n=1 Tax=Arachidicoccus sp. BS20 TaxID=1850526 RepID=UPI0018D3BB36|nr:hypothetical protein [Arachidicoccus sp. BS20]